MEPTGVDNDAKCHLKGRRRRCLHLSGVKAPPQPQAEKCHPSLTRVVHTQTYGMFGSLETGDCHELHRISQSHLAAAEGAVWRAVLRSFVRSFTHFVHQNQLMDIAWRSNKRSLRILPWYARSKARYIVTYTEEEEEGTGRR